MGKDCFEKNQKQIMHPSIHPFFSIHVSLHIFFSITFNKIKGFNLLILQHFAPKRQKIVEEEIEVVSPRVVAHSFSP